MRGPADDPADRKGRCEEGRRQVEAVQQQRGVELDVGVEPPIGLALAQQPEGGGLHGSREIVEASIAAARVELRRRCAEYVRARVADAIDAMAESHESFAAIEPGADHRVSPLRRADLE